MSIKQYKVYSVIGNLLGTYTDVNEVLNIVLSQLPISNKTERKVLNHIQNMAIGTNYNVDYGISTVRIECIG